MAWRFAWDMKKAELNFAKHGVRFSTASQVFFDPLALTFPDEEHSDDEERWITIGRAASSPRLLLVVHTTVEVIGGDLRVRLISAREATKHEQRKYESD